MLEISYMFYMSLKLQSDNTTEKCVFFSQYNCVVDYNNDDYCFMLYVLATWQNTQPEQYSNM